MGCGLESELGMLFRRQARLCRFVLRWTFIPSHGEGLATDVATRVERFGTAQSLCTWKAYRNHCA